MPYKGYKQTEEHKKNNKLANLSKHLGKNNSFYGKCHTEESKEKMRIAHLNKPAWNKGKKYSKKIRENISKGHEGQIPWNKGKKTGCIPWNKGKVGLQKHSTEWKEKMSKKMLGKNNPFYGKHWTEEQLKNILYRRIPTSLEEKFQSIVAKYNLPYKYVGDGSFIIGRYNPDFINTNSEKIAVEVYARYYKKRNHTSIEDWKRKRAEVFKQYGWRVIYFNEIEVNEENILNKLKKVTSNE